MRIVESAFENSIILDKCEKEMKNHSFIRNDIKILANKYAIKKRVGGRRTTYFWLDEHPVTGEIIKFIPDKY